jgi:hypothetical protein
MTEMLSTFAMPGIEHRGPGDMKNEVQSLKWLTSSLIPIH